MSLNGTLSKLDLQQENIKKRLDEFESPIGKLTLGFDDIILIFPIALVGGFLVCASILIDTMQLRRDYFKFHPRTCNDGIIRLTNQEIAHTASLWLDPKNAEQNKPIRIAVLMLPAIIFIASVILILYSWTIPESSLGGLDPFYRGVFAATYGISSVVLFTISYRRIFREYSKGAES